VIVHGESGSGKTALVDMLREPVCEMNSYFVAGKFFQLNATVPEPYSAIMAAFSDLCDLVIQSDDYDEDQRREMKNSLGADAQLLVKSISNLSPLVGDANGIEAIEASSFAQFRVACRTFLRSVASEKHPVVVFLDDIQWADEGSMQLIQMFLRDDSALDNVMFVLAYRDEEAAHLFESGMLDGVRDPTDIAVSNLNADAVHQMVTSMMGSSTDEIRQLSGLVAKRTFGNPLHVTMFMETIQQEGLLSYDNTTESWIFDLGKMQYEIMVSETLADLLTRKINRLSGNLKGTLKVASLLGYRFRESILLKVVNCMAIGERSALLLLSEAVQEGFIEQSGDGYHFSHDKVQSAFISLIDESEGARLHLLIGKIYLSAHEQGGEQSNIYRAAVHLSCAPDVLSEYEQRVTLARINLEAAKYCKEISAFEQAVMALQAGLDALRPAEKWSDELFALTFEMMETQARMQLAVGDFEACKATTLEASRHVRTSEMKVKLLAIDVEVRMAGNEVDDVVATANRGLSSLGFKMPRKAKLRHIVAKLAKVKFMLRRKTDEDLLNLPLTQDLVIANVVKLLIHLCTYCLMGDEKEMGVFSALLAIELTLKNSLSQHSPCPSLSMVSRKPLLGTLIEPTASASWL
jgi:predicted ATPase